MAEGRILSKRVTRSSKVSQLSSDTQRMIYSWLIPYLDVEGRMEADPRLLKADIAPLLDHITAETIKDALFELNSVGLIILYKINNKEYLQVTKFDENQPNLRKDREASSKIPGPTPDTLRTHSGSTPDLLPPKIREDKIREDKYTLDFEIFWKGYPKKIGFEEAAFDQWKRLNGTRPAIEIILDAIRKQIEWRETAGPEEFRPEWKDPERWIKNRMWEIEVEESGGSSIDAWARRKAEEEARGAV